MLLRRTLPCSAVLACVVLALVALSATADDKDKPALTGSWEKKASEPKIEFVDKDVMKIMPHGDKAMFVIVCSYTVDKQGLVKVTVTDYEGKEEIKQKAKGAIPIGLKFSFKWQAKDGVATLDDMKGEKIDPVKAHLEGDYEKK